MPTRLADQNTLLLQGRRYPEARDLRWKSTGGVHRTASSLAMTDDFCKAALSSTRDVPMGHGFGCGDGSCIDWHHRHVVCVCSALCPLIF